MENTERLKEVLITYLENMNNILNTRDDFPDRWYSTAQNKEFIIPFKTPIWKKSENLKSFLSHRQRIDKRVKEQFKKENKIPFVLRFHHLNKKNKEYFKNVEDVINYHNTITMGCHNIADRISVRNPKTIKSVRTFFSFPHYGKNEKLKQITGGKMKFSSKRVVDGNGKVWISHSINAIKNGNEFYQSFGEETIETLPITERKEYNETTFNLIGNDVLFDFDIHDQPFFGLYASFDYLKRDEFDFGDFTEEELHEVERWLDYEWLSLVHIQRKTFPLPQNRDLDENNSFTTNLEYVRLLEEVAKEKGFRFIMPLLLTNLQGGITHFSSMIGTKKGTNLKLKEILLSASEDDIETSFHDWKKELERKYDRMEETFDFMNDNLQITENGWFLPIHKEFNSPEDFRKQYFDDWFNHTFQYINEYKD